MKYIIITPAYNEEKYIENTLLSVISQTQLPKKWIIVDDGSIDNTRNIIKKYTDKYEFILLLSNKIKHAHNFSSKIMAFHSGYNIAKNIKYDLIGNLDADISFQNNYFENLIQEFKKDKKIGIAGGCIHEIIKGTDVKQDINENSVAGAIQLFRKECYEETGGYVPFKEGFVDGYIEILARKKGWKTKNFDYLKVMHYKIAGSSKGNRLLVKYKAGKIEYKFGYSFLYHVVRNISKLFEKPYILGSISSLIGYISCIINKNGRFVDKDFTNYLRTEHNEKLRIAVKKYIFN